MTVASAISRRLSPVGVELGGRWIKAAQLRRVGRAWRLHAAAKLERPAPAAPWSAAEAARLCSVLTRQGFEGAALVVGAPRDAVLNAVLELPPRSSGAPLEQIARVELARAGKLDPGSLEVAMWDLPLGPRAGTGTPVMAVAVPRDRGEALAATFDGLDREIAVLDVRVSAIYRAARAWAAPAGGIGVLVDVGWECAQICLINDSSVVFQRSLDELSLGRLYAGICQRTGLEIPDIDAAFAPPPGESPSLWASSVLVASRALVSDFLERLRTELTRSLGYASHRHADAAVRAVCITGEGADVPGLCERLGPACSVDARILRPADVALCPGTLERAATDPALMCAIGLAMHDVGSEPGTEHAS